MQQKHGSPPSIAENRKPYAFYSLNMVNISLAEMHKWHYKQCYLLWRRVLASMVA